jgi:ATP-binding cassette subfamily B protein
MTGIERFLEIMDSPIEVGDTEDAVPLPPVKGEIRFDKVSFRYSDNNKNVLSNIDLTVASGEHVALVGRRAAGRPPCAT